jgi:hypothetical protein
VIKVIADNSGHAEAKVRELFPSIGVFGLRDVTEYFLQQSITQQGEFVKLFKEMVEAMKSENKSRGIGSD